MGCSGSLNSSVHLNPCPPHSPHPPSPIPHAPQVLLSCGANVHVCDSLGQTALQYCMTLDKAESLECARLLLRAGARPLMPGPEKLLWPKGVDILDITGESLPHRAVRYGEPCDWMYELAA